PDVLRERQLGVALDRDVVVVVEGGEPPEPEMAGERRGLAGDPLLEVAVGGDRVRVMIDDVVAVAVEARREHALRQREAHGVGDPLAQRPGGSPTPWASRWRSA